MGIKPCFKKIISWHKNWLNKKDVKKMCIEEINNYLS